MEDSDSVIQKLLSTANHKEIIQDEKKLINFIKENSKYLQFLSDRNNTIEQNCYHISCSNIQHKEDLEGKKQKVQELCTQIKEASKKLNELIDLKEYFQNKFSFDSTIEVVQQEIQRLEIQSQEILQQFSDQKIDIDQFYEKFVHTKTAHYKTLLCLQLLWQSFTN